MPSDTLMIRAVANLRAAGLPEQAAAALAGRVVPILEQLRRQSEALPPATEPVVLFAAAPRQAEEPAR